MAISRPIFYSFRRCPYAMRARLAVQSAQISCELREILLRDKPQEMLSISPKGTVPVVQLPTGKIIDESWEVMLWALEQNDPNHWLPSSASAWEVVRNLVQKCDGNVPGGFKFHLDRMKYHTRYEDVEPTEHRAAANGFLALLDERLKESAFLVEDHFSLADAAIAPFVRQFANADLEAFQAAAFPRLEQWLSNFLNSAAFLSVMAKHPPWKAGEPGVEFPSQ